MVSFSCEVCNDTVLKKKLDGHKQRCRGAYFTCIDCSTTFSGNDYKQHTSCISEAEKYEKSLYKGNKKKNSATPVPKPEPVKKVEKKEEKVEKPTKTDKTQKEKKDKKTKSLDKYVAKSDNLYKIVKSISKDDSKDLKEVLKQLKVEKSSDGTFVISL